MAPMKYIEKVIANYSKLFNEEKLQKRVKLPLKPGDHPKLDDSELLHADGIQKYQSIIGLLQWAISLGRFDIATAVMTLSGFCAMIRFHTNQPDFSDVESFEYEWENIYCPVSEGLPHDTPEPLGRHVTLSHYVGANLMHCLLTGRSITGILHFINQTQSIGFQRNKRPSRRQPSTVPSLSPQERVLSKRSTYVTHYAILEFRLTGKVLCLATMNLLSTV